jgi:hypothetical protein
MTLKVAEPPTRSAGVKVPDVKTLVEKLKTEAKVLCEERRKNDDSGDCRTR